MLNLCWLNWYYVLLQNDYVSGIILITPFLTNIILWMNGSWKPCQLKIPFIIYMCVVQIVTCCPTLMYKSNCDSNVYVFYGHISKEVFLLLSCWTSVKRDCILILNQLKNMFLRPFLASKRRIIFYTLHPIVIHLEVLCWSFISQVVKINIALLFNLFE